MSFIGGCVFCQSSAKIGFCLPNFCEEWFDNLLRFKLLVRSYFICFLHFVLSQDSYILNILYCSINVLCYDILIFSKSFFHGQCAALRSEVGTVESSAASERTSLP